jgi:hypothetical protein
MNSTDTKPKRVYFRQTTAQQRKLLFETYEEIGNVSHSCRVAHVGRRTFYYWLPRFQEGGYAALQTPRSRAPHTTRIPPTAEAIVQEVIAYRRAHPQAGYRSVANAVCQAHGWERVIGHTKVRKILLAAGLVTPHSFPGRAKQPPAVHAPQPEQTVNVDLCLTPLTHTAEEELGSASLSDAAQKGASRRR